MRTWMNSLRIVGAVAAAGTLTWLAISPVEKSTASTAAVLTPTNVALADALQRSNLGPEEFAAAGFDVEQVENALSDTWTYLVQHEFDLSNADDNLRSAAENYQRLKRLVHTRQATEQEETEFEQAETAYENALAARQAALDAIFSAGIADVAQSPEAQLISTIRANHKWRTPWEFLVIDREERSWVDLREALAAERIAIANNEEVDPGAAALLAQERQNPTVAAAITSLSENLDEITQAWNEAVAPQE